MSLPPRLLVLGAAMLLMALSAWAAEVAGERIRYALCRTNVASSAVMRMGEEYGLQVRLKREAGRELARLIDRNPEATLELVFGDRLLLRGPAASFSRSGLFVAPIGDIDATRRALAELEANLWEGPCGLVADSEP